MSRRSKITKWASDPKIMKRLHYSMSVFWLLNIPVVFVLGLEGSVPYLVTVSIWTLVIDHWTAGLTSAGREDGKS